MGRGQAPLLSGSNKGAPLSKMLQSVIGMYVTSHKYSSKWPGCNAVELFLSRACLLPTCLTLHVFCSHDLTCLIHIYRVAVACLFWFLAVEAMVRINVNNRRWLTKGWASCEFFCRFMWMPCQALQAFIHSWELEHFWQCSHLYSSSHSHLSFLMYLLWIPETIVSYSIG